MRTPATIDTYNDIYIIISLEVYIVFTPEDSFYFFNFRVRHNNLSFDERHVVNIYAYKVNAFLAERREILYFLILNFSLIAYYSFLFS